MRVELPAPERRRASAALPGTCGELVQGTLDGTPCLVSGPIDRYTTARLRLEPDGGWQISADAPKSEAALRACLAQYAAAGWGANLRLISDLPRGRGYGSSTADIGATLYAAASALHLSLPAEAAARLAVAVEPSDSTLFGGLALFAHCTGEFYEALGSAPPLSVLVIDPGGEVDTVAYNRQDHRAALRPLAPSHREAFALLHGGLRGKDWRSVGAAATLSARLHQAILFNPLLDSALLLAENVKALGVCRAHSGTLLGLLLDPNEADVDSAIDFVVRRLPRAVTVHRYKLVDGGPCYL